MKGDLIGGLISIMVGAVLIFAVIVPILNNGTLGTLYPDETITNATEGATYTILTTACNPIRSDLTYVKAYNTTGTDLTSKISVYDATNGKFKYTNATTVQEDSIVMDYRCLDSAYIDSNIGRTMANYIVPIVLILLIVGLTAFII